MARRLIIAIDGLVGAGKSTTARKVAAALGYRHLDTGAMYRALTLAAMRQGVEAGDETRLAALLERTAIEWEPSGGGGRILLDGKEVEAQIRRPEISRRVGAYSDVPLVRRALVQRQRQMGREGGVVAEGRDAGAVIFPAAELKIRMVADLEERARRRWREWKAKGVMLSLRQVEEEIRERDRADARRDYGARPDPCQTIEIDTSVMSIAQQVERIVSLARERGA